MDCGMWVWREGGVVGESVHNARMSDLYVLNRPLVEVAGRTMLTVIASVEVVAFFDLAVTSNLGARGARRRRRRTSQQ